MVDLDLLATYEQSFKANFNSPAISDYGVEGSTLTYGEFARRVARIHLMYERYGIKPGDKIALVGKNSSSWVITFMATVTYGAVIVPVLADFSPQDATHIVNHSDAVMLVVSASIWEYMDYDRLPQVRAVISLDTRKVLAERLSADYGAPVAEPGLGRLCRIIKNLSRMFRRRYPKGFNPENISYPRLPKDNVCVINYTSGTTGFSKGVMLTLDNLAGNVGYGINANIHFKTSRCLAFLPLAHAYGCAFDMLVPLAVGTHITVFGKPPVPQLLIKAFAEVKPTLIVTVPLVLEKIYRKMIVPMITRRPIRWILAVPLLDTAIYATIKSKLVSAFGGEFVGVIVGGAPLNPEVEDFLHKIHFPVSVGYGMTECGPLISFSPWGQYIPHSVGRALPDIMEAATITPDDDAAAPVSDGAGEVIVRGQNVMKGYYKNPDATELVLQEDGWLHTGDMGYVKDQVIYLKGRYKTMILTASGQNVYPEEIEAKLNNMPYVSESLVVERNGGLIALVYPDYEMAEANGVSDYALREEMEKIRREVNQLVAPYEQLAKIQLVANEFEKTPKRSIKRYLYNA